MKRKPYPEYKPSRVELLGDVPSHWNVIHLKHIISEPLKYGANESAELDDTSLPRFIRITDVDSNGQLHEDTFKSLPFAIAKEFLLQEGDILFARSGATVGKSFLYKREWGICAFAGYLIRARFNKSRIHSEYIKYFTNSHQYWSWITAFLIQSTIQNVSAEKYGNMFVPLPTLEEQTRIIDYLYRETARIDSLLEKKQRQIELLREKRTALISRAVTKGLDPNAPMKPSGIPWLGEIPSHWELRRIRQKATINPNKGEVSFFPKNTELQFLPMECIGVDGSLNLENTRILSDVETGYTFFAEGDVVYAKITPCFENGKGAIMNGLHHGYGFGTTELTVLRPKKDISANYLYYITISDVFRKIGQSWMYGAGGQKRVPDEFVKNLFLGWPPYKEYIFITDYLDIETAKIDGLIQKIEFSMELLREYRASLISACVTGKIDVRGNIDYEKI